MEKVPYCHLSQVVDFNRYINTKTATRGALRAFLFVILSSYNIYKVKTTSCAKRINYTRYLKSTKKARFTKITRFIKSNLGEIQIVGAVVGVAVFIFFIN
jgi:hypothetical protein